MRRVGFTQLLRRLAFSVFFCGYTYGLQAAQSDESTVKVAFIYNFLRLAVWPEPPISENGALTVCLTAQHNLGDALHGLRDKTAQTRAIDFRILNAPNELSGCRLLFIGQNDGIKTWLTASQAASVLTISDAVSFIDRGGMIGLVMEGARVRFEVNLDVLRHAQIRLSADVLELARRVEGDQSLN